MTSPPQPGWGPPVHAFSLGRLFGFVFQSHFTSLRSCQQLARAPDVSHADSLLSVFAIEASLIFILV